MTGYELTVGHLTVSCDWFSVTIQLLLECQRQFQSDDVLMDWMPVIEIVERLAPFLAWPIVALIAFPFVIWRLGAVWRLYSLMSSDDGKKFVSDLSTVTDKLAKMREESESLRDLIKGLQQDLKEVDEDRIDQESAKLELRSLRSIPDGQTGEISPADEIDTSPYDHLSSEELYRQITQEWERFRDELRNKLNQLGLDFDLRSVSTAIARLADQRRTNSLSEKDVEYISDLHSQYKRFTRLRSSKDEWLTKGIAATFISSLGDACELVGKVSSRS